MENISTLIFLFFSAFFAATIFPAQSELVLSIVSASNKYNNYLLVTVASFGNILGSLVNWLLGYYIVFYKDKKWFPVSTHKINKYSAIYQKWGIWTLLLAWLPIVGDPLTLVAGALRTNLIIFLILVTIGKIARYIFIIQII